MIPIAWSTLPTYADGTTLTAAMLTAIKDNVNESAAAKATAAGEHFVATAANALAARTTDQDIVETENTRTITTYGALATAGPSITMTTGAKALVWFEAAMKNNTSGSNSYVAVDITGATTLAADDTRSMVWQGGADQYSRYAVCNLPSTTAGSNTFRLYYRVDANTGTFKWRRIQVMGF